MKLRNLVQGLFIGAALVATPLFSADREGTNQPKEFVAPNTIDVRGTWYEHGWSGGWFGPEKEYNFNFWSFRQYGNKIQGVLQHELYDHEEGDLTGTINGNKLVLTVPEINYGAATNRITLEATIGGNGGRGTKFEKRISPLDSHGPWTTEVRLERVSTNYGERVPPKAKEVKKEETVK